ncbi:hypothetical protein P6709_12860 [Jeotgalibacillus sp. ET6]|uniref:hypothetical protein n=1 Tax=Jeotgalibacillus sp. ET6 TaxID=3037260 RepID=UPI0024184B6B|nr:hypothetical protein [Jeotgalibacillus sp. ET6]MDG5472640.1 hypothetical protein [Jeotgalibacillus sp. ET6]
MEIEQVCAEIKKKMEKTDWTGLWPDFKPVPYCIYNKEKVCLFNHPVFPGFEGQPAVFDWEEQFVGSTLILYKDYPTAIVSIDQEICVNYLYTVLIHEIFHGYQTTIDEKRFPDELKGVSYPLSIENISLRIKERRILFDAFEEKDPEKKMKSLQTFCFFRNKREAILKGDIDYEYRLESVEGPACYVKFQAIKTLEENLSDSCLQFYRQSLLDSQETNLHLRKSCYVSGLFLCLLLDQIDEKWKESFVRSDLTLYEFVLSYIDSNFTQVNEEALIASEEACQVYQYVYQQKNKKIQEFKNSDGYKLTIEGDMKATFFDPINMVNVGNRLLHRYFVKLQINQQDYLINQPALIYYGDNFLQFNRLQLNLPHKPLLQNGFISIEGIGSIPGKYKEDGMSLHLTVE